MRKKEGKKKDLGLLFEKYKLNLCIESVSLPNQVELHLRFPRSMLEEFMAETGQRRRNPVSFWKRLNFRNRLLELSEEQIGSMYGTYSLSDALDYLGDVNARFADEYANADSLVIEVQEKPEEPYFSCDER